MSKIKLESVYEHLLRGHVFDDRDEEEFLLWMLLLHTHEIHLRTACIEDAPGLLIIKPATQRAAADAVAEMWGDRRDSERTSYRYWYRMYQLKSPGQAKKELKQPVVQKLQRLKEKLESHPLVKSVKFEP
jgi:hypothetical protein